MAWLLPALVALAALLLGWLLGSARANRRADAGQAALREQADRWRNDLDLASNEHAKAQERASRVPQLESDLAALRAAGEAARGRSEAELRELHARVAELTKQIEGEQKAAAEKLALLQGAREDLTAQFRNLAAEILEDKSKRFTEQNKAGLDALLTPLHQRIADFRARVDHVYDDENRQRAALGQELAHLKALNQNMSSEARELTQALKGQSKLRGNWGETVLERVLESGGLRRGFEYDVQQHVQGEDGRLAPDVVVRLPGDRRLVIDSKVSLVHYLAASSADSEEERADANRRHVQSVKKHVSDLAGKNYGDAIGGAGLDFVLMFMPIEPAFHVALSHDDKLYEEAMRKNILLVSPLTLLSAMRLIEQLWRQEKQKQNVQEIYRQAGELHAKLVEFVKQFEDVGKSLRSASAQHDSAYRLLTTGPGNAIRRAENLRELGAKSKSNKGFSAGALANAGLDEDNAERDVDSPGSESGAGSSSPE